jgi:hypothetical protein
MSGYLQRLARNAMTPSRSIHPAVASIFSPLKEERIPAPLLEYDEIETVENRAESLARIAPAIPSGAVDAPRANEVGEGEISRVDGEPRHEAFRPLARMSRPPVPAVTTGRIAPPLKQPGPLRNAETEPQPGIHVEPEEPYTPLLPPAVPSADAEGEIFRASETVVSTASKKDAARVPRHGAVSKSEADEIQIHIGRIEVTAVPPAAARPAVVPVSKSVNLDEYLKRGRGRAR